MVSWEETGVDLGRGGVILDVPGVTGALPGVDSLDRSEDMEMDRLVLSFRELLRLRVSPDWSRLLVCWDWPGVDIE